MKVNLETSSAFKEFEFVTGIHNYCDRWCERCPMTARCRVFAMERETTDDERDINNEAFWRNLQNTFAQAKETLRQTAAELGIDLNAVSDGEFAEHRCREKKLIEREDLTKLAETYCRQAKAVLENKDEWLMFSTPDRESQNEMLSVIYWYQYFIAAKIQRGLRGILDFDGKPDEEELNDAQSDANGSIKVALAAVRRSLMAWTALMTEENSPHIKPLLNLLEIIEQKAEARFPFARDFIRPGFDEVEAVM